MDHSLTCNNLKCRAELSDRALVTTCSHIFCLECANRQLLLQCDAHNRANCPACGTELSSAEDAAVTNLRPTEAYKTSILSGLSPSTIMECAGRALSFWAYQTTQEICYQQYLYKTLTDKYSALSVRLDQVVKEANAEIDGLQGKLAAVTIERDNSKKKSEELAKAYKEKSRKLVQTQESYDRLKRRVEMGHIQRAASDAVDSRIHAKPADGSHSIDLPQPNGQQHQQHQQHQPYPAAPQLQVNRPGAPDNSRFQANNSSSHAAINPPNYWQYDTPMPIASHPMGHGLIGQIRSREGGQTSHPLGNNIVGNHATPNTSESIRFGQTRGSLSGIGLSSGLKVSQAPEQSVLSLTSGLRRA